MAAGVPAITALRSVFLIAKMFVHLDLETGLEHLLGELTQQSIRADQIDPFRLGLCSELLRDRRIDLPRQL